MVIRVPETIHSGEAVHHLHLYTCEDKLSSNLNRFLNVKHMATFFFNLQVLFTELMLPKQNTSWNLFYVFYNFTNYICIYIIWCLCYVLICYSCEHFVYSNVSKLNVSVTLLHWPPLHSPGTTAHRDHPNISPSQPTQLLYWVKTQCQLCSVYTGRTNSLACLLVHGLNSLSFCFSLMLLLRAGRVV